MNRTWNLEGIKKIAQTHEHENNRPFENFAKKWKADQTYLIDPRTLLKSLKEFVAIVDEGAPCEDEAYYWYLKHVQNQSDARAKRMAASTDIKRRKAYREIDFYTKSLARISRKMREHIMGSHAFDEYKHFLQGIFDRERHGLKNDIGTILLFEYRTTVDDLEEKFLEKLESGTGTVSSNGRTKRKRSFRDLFDLLSDEDEQTRKTAARAFSDILKQNEKRAERELNAVMKIRSEENKAGHFVRPDARAAAENDIPLKIVDQSLRAVAHASSLAKKYYALKARLLKSRTLHYYELYAPYRQKHDVATKHKDSVKVADALFKSLDPQFASFFRQYVREGRIQKSAHDDSYYEDETESRLRRQPAFILLHAGDTLKDHIILVHEFGHILGFEFARRHQNILNLELPNAPSEIASTLFERLFLDHFLATTKDPSQQLGTLMHYMDNLMWEIFEKAAAYGFSYDLYKLYAARKHLSSKAVSNLFRVHMRRYLGKSVSISSDDARQWIYWINIRYNFYDYSYVFGTLVSLGMMRKLRTDKNRIRKIKQYLSSGNSDSPERTLKRLGLDVAQKQFWEDGLHEIGKLLEQTTAVAKKLNLI